MGPQQHMYLIPCSRIKNSIKWDTEKDKNKSSKRRRRYMYYSCSWWSAFPGICHRALSIMPSGPGDLLFVERSFIYTFSKYPLGMYIFFQFPRRTNLQSLRWLVFWFISTILVCICITFLGNSSALCDHLEFKSFAADAPRLMLFHHQADAQHSADVCFIHHNYFF